MKNASFYFVLFLLTKIYWTTLVCHQGLLGLKIQYGALLQKSATILDLNTEKVVAVANVSLSIINYSDDIPSYV